MADIRVTQDSIQLFIQDSTLAVTQQAVELFIHEDAHVRISESNVEIYQDDFFDLNIVSRGIRLRSWLTSDTGPDPRNRWIVDDRSKKIYLIRLRLRRLVGGSLEYVYLYLSNFAYNTHPNEDPANTPYRNCLLNANIPPLVQNLSEVFYGISTASYGQLIIDDVRRELIPYLPPSYTWDGGEIYIRLTGDRQELPLVYALDILYGRIGAVEFGDMQIKAEIFSKHKQLEKKKINEGTFKGLEDADITDRIPWGICKNIEPVLIDDIDLIYKFASVPCQSVDAVYDDGVTIAAEDYVTNLATSTVQLLINPAGKVTLDVHGIKMNGTFSAKRGDWIRYALEVYGKIIPGNFIENTFLLFNELAGGDSGIYLTETTEVLSFVTTLLFPVLGYMVIDRYGRISLGIMTIPEIDGTFDIDISETNMLPVNGGDTKDSDKGLETSFHTAKTLSRIINKSTLLYDQNNTPQDESVLGDDVPVETDTPEGRARRAWLKEEWRKVSVLLAGTLATLYEDCSEPQDEINSYFINRVDAATFCQKWLEFFGFDRRVVTIRTKIEPLQFTIGATARLTLSGVVVGYGRVIGYKEDYAQNAITTDFIA